ncbi:BTAD domain-containing putative transcriptional regulator [Nonomuraea longicatena]
MDGERVAFGVLGPVAAWDAHGGALALKGPRHRAVLARLIVARRRVVPVARLVEDLWEDPGPGAVGAVQTFVAALRRVLEPDRPPRTPARLLVTEGPGYALRAAPDAVDAWRFEAVVRAAAGLPPERALTALEEAAALWRGPAYAEHADEHWALGERRRLAELRLSAAEQVAEARLALGLAREAVPDLDAHVAEHPWREDAWRLLALALYRTGRQSDALAVLRRARTMLAGQFGVDPGPGLRRLETAILNQDPGLDPRPEKTDRYLDHDELDARRKPGLDLRPEDTAARSRGSGDEDTGAEAGGSGGEGTAADRLWARAASDFERTVEPGARLRSAVGLLRDLAVTGGGGLTSAREHRLQAVVAAEELGDPELTARVIGAYDVPAIWTRADDPEQAHRIVAAAERTLAALTEGREPLRCRLLATIAVESRGTRSPRGPQAAREAEEIARQPLDPARLAFGLNGVFMQSCTRAGLADRRDAVGAELVELSERHGLATFELLGHLIRTQALGALGDLGTADVHAAAADRLAARDDRPLARVFTGGYRALRLAAAGRIAEAEAAYRALADRLAGAGMPGVTHGFLPLALLCLRLARLPGPAGGLGPVLATVGDAGAGWGPYRLWAEPFALLRDGRRAQARAALHALPEPPADLLYEVLCCLEVAVAAELGDRERSRLLHARLLPAAHEVAGAGSGLVTLGPVRRWLRMCAP